MTYLFDPMDGSIRGNGIRKDPKILGDGVRTYQKVREMAYIYDAEDNLSVTVEYTHYEIPNVRRSELSRTLARFASAPDEVIEKYRVRKNL